MSSIPDSPSFGSRSFKSDSSLSDTLSNTSSNGLEKRSRVSKGELKSAKSQDSSIQEPSTTTSRGNISLPREDGKVNVYVAGGNPFGTWMNPDSVDRYLKQISFIAKQEKQKISEGDKELKDRDSSMSKMALSILGVRHFPALEQLVDADTSFDYPIHYYPEVFTITRDLDAKGRECIHIQTGPYTFKKSHEETFRTQKVDLYLQEDGIIKVLVVQGKEKDVRSCETDLKNGRLVKPFGEDAKKISLWLKNIGSLKNKMGVPDLFNGTTAHISETCNKIKRSIKRDLA